MKIGIVYNPFAGGNKTKAQARKNKLENILGSRGIVRETRSLEDIDSVAREFYQQEIDILGISGGDGTNHCVLTRFFHVYGEKPLPTVTLLRGGTMNLLERSLGMRGTPEARLSRLIDVLEKGEYPVISHTVLRVNDKLGYIFGNGLVANFMEEYYQGGNVGVGKVLSILFKTFSGALWQSTYVQRLFAPVKAHIEIDNRLLPETSFGGLLAATERECGLGFKPFYRAREEQGKLHFLAFNLTAGEIFRNLPRLHAGRPLRHHNSVYEALTAKVVVNTQEPYHYTLDGEMLNSTTRLEISSGPIIPLVNI